LQVREGDISRLWHRNGSGPCQETKPDLKKRCRGLRKSGVTRRKVTSRHCTTVQPVGSSEREEKAFLAQNRRRKKIKEPTGHRRKGGFPDPQKNLNLYTGKGRTIFKGGKKDAPGGRHGQVELNEKLSAGLDYKTTLFDHAIL